MAEISLEIVEGPEAGRLLPLERRLEIGRDGDADIVLTDDLVSWRHARVRPSDGGALVEDLGSRNGTFVNGDEVHAPTRLAPGDQILLGVTVLELRSARQIAAQPTAVRPVPPALATPERVPDYVPPLAAAEGEAHPLTPLLDVHAKAKARTAPLAVFVLVVFAVLIFLATR